MLGCDEVIPHSQDPESRAYQSQKERLERNEFFKDCLAPQRAVLKVSTAVAHMTRGLRTPRGGACDGSGFELEFTRCAGQSEGSEAPSRNLGASGRMDLLLMLPRVLSLACMSNRLPLGRML